MRSNSIRSGRTESERTLNVLAAITEIHKCSKVAFHNCTQLRQLFKYKTVCTSVKPNVHSLRYTKALIAKQSIFNAVKVYGRCFSDRIKISLSLNVFVLRTAQRY